MRRIILWLVGTVVTVVLLFSYRTSTSSSPAASSLTTTAPPGAGFDGKLVQTRYGAVQVRIIVAHGRITEIVLLTAPGGSERTDQITKTALPELRNRALAAQSADIDTVSGATCSSDGYRESLQAAIDKANP
jgi:uncharacterized protein with FMN-binding domain